MRVHIGWLESIKRDIALTNIKEKDENYLSEILSFN